MSSQHLGQRFYRASSARGSGSGLGLSVVPASMAGTHAHSVAYRPLPRDPRLEAPMTTCWSRDNQNPALMTDNGSNNSTANKASVSIANMMIPP